MNTEKINYDNYMASIHAMNGEEFDVSFDGYESTIEKIASYHSGISTNQSNRLAQTVKESIEEDEA